MCFDSKREGLNMHDRLTLRPGDMRDYAALAPFHYLRQSPGGVARVLVLEDRTPSIVERYVTSFGAASCRGGEGGVTLCGDCGAAARDCQSPTATRVGPERQASGSARRGQVVAVLVESYPALSCTLRDEATGGRYRGWSRSEAARLINAELRCISRVIVHPQWRGLGLAVGLVKHALATADVPGVEALAAMGRVHPFFALAGMTEYRRWPLERDQRLRDALSSCGIALWQLASTSRMLPLVEASALLRRELSRWAGRRLPVVEQLELARERLLVEPVYYLWSARKAEGGKHEGHEEYEEEGGGTAPKCGDPRSGRVNSR